jgi:hypothetical protein
MDELPRKFGEADGPAEYVTKPARLEETRISRLDDYPFDPKVSLLTHDPALGDPGGSLKSWWLRPCHEPQDAPAAALLLEPFSALLGFDYDNRSVTIGGDLKRHNAPFEMPTGN